MGRESAQFKHVLLLRYFFHFQAKDWTPLKQSPKLFVKNPNIYSVSTENIETLVNKDFQIPLKPEFGSKYKRRKPAFKKQSRPAQNNQKSFNSLPDISNITDAPKLEKTITEGDIENNLARPIMIVATDAATERVDVLPTPAKPLDWNKKERVLYKSKIKWLNRCHYRCY